MERSHFQKKRHNSGIQGVKPTCKKKKTYSKSEMMLADTYCQTVTMQVKIEENDAECQTDRTNSQFETGYYSHPQNLLCPKSNNKSKPHSTEVGDRPLLRQPQHTTLTGIQQIIECFRSGTAQAKLVLLKEIDVIFECQLCRSLFRGLPNLIEHRMDYCLSRQPEPDDPSQVMKDLLEAVFPDRVQEKTSPIKTLPKPVYHDQPFTQAPNSSQLNSLSQKLDDRKPVVILRRLQPHAASDEVDSVSQQAWGLEPIETDDADEDSCSNVQDTMTSAVHEHLESDPECKNISQPNHPKQFLSSHKAVHVNLGWEDGIEYVPNLKKLFSCTHCERKFISKVTLTRHMSVYHKFKRLRKVTAEKNLIKPAPGNMDRNGEACKDSLSSSGEWCEVCQKSFDKKNSVRCCCNEVLRSFEQDCTKPAQYFSTQTTAAPQKTLNSKPVKDLPSHEAEHFNRECTNPLMKDLFYCGLCKSKYNSQVMLIKHMSTTHKFHVLENSSAAIRTPPSRKVKTKLKPETEAFDNVRVYCWLCGKNFGTRKGVQKHCYTYHRQKLHEINILMREDTGPLSMGHGLHSLRNGFAASRDPPTHLPPTNSPRSLYIA
ncbi:zinc finger protein 800-like [Hoplias malabaricus]|uniref:zinc finger protein 800-like n=1 Tax=Hoplias malabaricus TaxID=27720 RepID=UPI0034618F4C